MNIFKKRKNYFLIHGEKHMCFLILRNINLIEKRGCKIIVYFQTCSKDFTYENEDICDESLNEILKFID